MLKKNSSKTLQRLSKKVSEETTFGRDLIAGAKQILAHVQGRRVLKEYTLATPLNVREIRAKVGMSQANFAKAFCLNHRTIQQWEQGKAQPDLAVRAYLTVIERNPEAVMNALRLR